MSSNVKKYSILSDNPLHCESHKKTKRKRHRNRFRNSNLKKKKLKKFHYKIKPHVKSNVSESYQVNDNSKVMSDWYWSNYKKAIEWQEKHRTAHWKACTIALLEENRQLLHIINQLNPGVRPAVALTQNYINKGGSSRQRHKNFTESNPKNFMSKSDENNEDNEEIAEDEEVNDDNDVADVEFEMSEEMMQFFEQSYKHKMEMKELKEKESLRKTENEIKEIQTNKIRRSNEMNFLYGEGASMIIGMETAVQLSFEKYCDTKSPKYWPNIPFRL